MSKILILALLTFLNYPKMGMYYFIEADRATTCDLNFPEGLSYFFEQVGGYDDKSIVSQIEKILEIDLSVFQQISFDDDVELPFETNESLEIWIDIDLLYLKINSLMSLIESNSDYYNSVVYNESAPLKFNKTNFEKKIKEFQKNVAQDSTLLYPQDKGYLPDELNEDLNKLKYLLECLKIDKVERIKFLYM